MVRFANWWFAHLAGTLDGRGLTDQMRVDVERVGVPRGGVEVYFDAQRGEDLRTMSDARVLVANPVDVATADQAAAALGPEVTVQLTTWAEPGEAYLIDRHVAYRDLLDEVARKLGQAD